MASIEGSPAASSVSSLSPRVLPISRIRHARQVHEELTQREWRTRTHPYANKSMSDEQSEDASPPAKQKRGGMDVAALAEVLQRLLRVHESSRAHDSPLALRVEKIGSHEKDALVILLLEQVAFLQSQRDDVVGVGEKLTTKLVQQQHEMRAQFKAQSTRLQEQLHEALHNHPEISRLEDKIAELEQKNAQCEQKLLFAAQKLHRSRQRERALRKEQENDPLLWDL